MQTLILMVGPSGSGKTTWAKDYIKLNSHIVRICPDEFRALYSFKNDESDQSVNHLVFKNLEIFVDNLLNNGYTVLIDATNYNRKNRKTWINLAKKYNVWIVGYIFSPNIQLCKERNKLRDRKVPEEVIDRQFNNFEEPGFDEIHEKIVL